MTAPVEKVACRPLNTVADSPNRIHNEDGSRSYGFRAALVPGLTSCVHMSAAPLRSWGAGWLGSGSMTARFVRPVYDSEELEVAWWTDDPSGPGERLALEMLDHDGVRRVVGYATRSSSPPPSGWHDYPTGDGSREVDWSRYLAGVPVELPELVFEVDASDPTLQYMMDVVGSHVGEPDVPPAYVASAASRIMTVAFDFTGPRIHLETVINQYRQTTLGETLRARCRIEGVRASKGRSIVETDTLVVDGSEQPVVHTLNTGMYPT